MDELPDYEIIYRAKQVLGKSHPSKFGWHVRVGLPTVSIKPLERYAEVDFRYDRPVVRRFENGVQIA